MLITGSVLGTLPLGSIRSAARIGYIDGLLVNPHNLHIDAFYCQVVRSKKLSILSPIDIRDISTKGVIIDDHDLLLEEDEAIRLQPIIDLHFKMQGLNAYVGKSKVGTIEDFAVDTNSLFIQQIYVSPTLIRKLGSPRLVFSRSNVKEITPQAIYFHDSTVEEKQTTKPLRLKQLLTQATSSTANTSLTKS